MHIVNMCRSKVWHIINLTPRLSTLSTKKLEMIGILHKKVKVDGTSSIIEVAINYIDSSNHMLAGCHKPTNVPLIGQIISGQTSNFYSIGVLCNIHVSQNILTKPSVMKLEI